MSNDLIDTRKLTDLERRRFYSEWSQSGLSKTRFCKEQRIPVETFYYWHRRYRQGASFKEGFSLLQVKRTKTESTYEQGVEIGMRLPSQVQLQMKVSMAQLIELIRGLSDAAAVIR